MSGVPSLVRGRPLRLSKSRECHATGPLEFDVGEVSRGTFSSSSHALGVPASITVTEAALDVDDRGAGVGDDRRAPSRRMSAGRSAAGSRATAHARAASLGARSVIATTFTSLSSWPTICSSGADSMSTTMVTRENRALPSAGATARRDIEAAPREESGDAREHAGLVFDEHRQDVVAHRRVLGRRRGYGSGLTTHPSLQWVHHDVVVAPRPRRPSGRPSPRSRCESRSRPARR